MNYFCHKYYVTFKYFSYVWTHVEYLGEVCVRPLGVGPRQLPPERLNLKEANIYFLTEVYLIKIYCMWI